MSDKKLYAAEIHLLIEATSAGLANALAELIASKASSVALPVNADEARVVDADYTNAVIEGSRVNQS